LILLFIRPSAQPRFYQSNLLEIKGSTNKNYSFAFTGGIKFPVFESMDLNNDQKEDIVVLDRADNRLLTFINQGITDSVKYLYRPQFEGAFPYFESFIRFYDYNRDGLKDIFTFTYDVNAGLTVYQNTSTGWSISFKKVVNNLSAKYFKTYYANLYVSSLDLPVIRDIDNDGDADILTFGVLGQLMELYDNLSIDSFSIDDSLRFEYADACWGKFKEDDLSNKIILPFSCAAVRGGSLSRHAGSTIELIDYDNDGDQDLILGDVQYPTLNLLINGKKEYHLNYDSMIAIQKNFPSNHAVQIRNMPAAFFIDVNNDGQKDLIASPMDMSIIDTFQSLRQIWLYLGNDTSGNHQFDLISKTFLQDQMLDFGGVSKPVIFDINADGKNDLLVATQGDFYYTYFKNDHIEVFLNKGNNEKPVFELADTNFLNLMSLGLSGISPAFGDLDFDGDADLLLGLKNGTLMFFKNNAGSGQPPVFQLSSSFLDSIDVGEYASPHIYDIDKDGFGDLLIGCENGTISYYHNETSGIHPLTFSLIDNQLGDMQLLPGNKENVFPFIADINNDQMDDLIVGCKTLGLFYISDILSNLSKTFSLKQLKATDFTTNNIINKSIGNMLYPAPVDVNNDHKLDLILGNQRGGLLFYSSLPDTINVSLPENLIQDYTKAIIFPNPAKHLVYINLNNAVSNYQIQIFNFYGQVMYENRSFNNNEAIDVSAFEKGIYLVKINSNNGCFIKRLIVTN